MEDLLEGLAGGRVTEVKIVLTSVVAALAVYQVILIAIGYGKLRLPFLRPKPASTTHRAVGDTIVPITLLVGVMCLSYFGIEDGIEHAGEGEQGRVLLHTVAGFALVGVIALKIVVVRWWHRMNRFLPLLGLSVLTLFVITWLSSAGAYI